MVSGIFLLTCALLAGSAFALQSLTGNEQVRKELHDMKEVSSGHNAAARYISNTTATTTTTTITTTTTTNKNNNGDADHNKDLYSTVSPTPHLPPTHTFI